MAFWASAESLPDVAVTDRFLIIGAGPTGSLLALGLARRRLAVLSRRLARPMFTLVTATLGKYDQYERFSQ